MINFVKNVLRYNLKVVQQRNHRYRRSQWALVRKPSIYLKKAPATNLKLMRINNSFFFIFIKTAWCFLLLTGLENFSVLKKRKHFKFISKIQLKKKEIARSPGSIAYAVKKTIILCSGTRLKPALIQDFLVGRTICLNNMPHKSSSYYWKRTKIVVRGVAKNAYDHYNGGKGRCSGTKFN